MKKENFNKKLFLDQLGIDIENDNYKESVKKLHQLCINNPFRTQQFVQVYINVWCVKILNMLDNKSFDIASSRIRALYMLIIYNKAFNRLITIYFDKVEQKKIFQTLGNYDRAVHLSMQSQYLYQKGQYDKVEKSVLQCFKEIKKLFKNKSQFNDGLLLIRKCLKKIKDKKKAEVLLKKILQNIVSY